MNIRAGILLLLIAGALAPAPLRAEESTAAGNAVPMPGSSAAPTPAAPALAPAEGKKLLGAFQRAQVAELRALQHRQSFELKDLAASQKSRRKEWEQRETQARHKFFAEHTKGPERRAYIKDFIERRKGYFQQLAEEKAQRRQEQKVRLASFKDDQKARFLDFKARVERGERPPTELWPAAGR